MEEKEGVLVENWQKRVSTRRHLYRETIPLFFLCVCSLLLLSAPPSFILSTFLILLHCVCVCFDICLVYFSLRGNVCIMWVCVFYGKLEKIETPGCIYLPILTIKTPPAHYCLMKKAATFWITCFTYFYLATPHPSLLFSVLIPFFLSKFSLSWLLENLK